MPTKPRLDSGQMAAYLALMEVGNLLQHAVEQQLHEAGGLSYTQFQILAVLAGAPDGQLRMTDIADHLVHSRSGLTYQATRLADAGLVTKAPAGDDERSIVVTVTAHGREALARALPGHVEVVQRLLMAPLSSQDTTTLGHILGRVRNHMRAQPPRSVIPRKRVPRGTAAADYSS